MEENRELVNVFSDKIATPKFQEIGAMAYIQYISTRLLEPSSNTNSPLPCWNFLTMSLTRSKNMMTPKNMKSSKSLSVYNIDWQWYNENGMAFDSDDEQYSKLPRAVADENACPHKSIVSSPSAYAHDHAKVFAWLSMWAAKKLLYRKAAKSLYVSTAISHCWHVTIDVMFMIYSKPLRRTATTVWFNCIRSSVSTKTL